MSDLGDRDERRSRGPHVALGTDLVPPSLVGPTSRASNVGPLGRPGSLFEFSTGLAMARSLGDRCVKDVGVIADPVVVEYALDPARDDFLIIASDGIWEFIPSDFAVALGVGPSPCRTSLVESSSDHIAREQPRFERPSLSLSLSLSEESLKRLLRVA